MRGDQASGDLSRLLRPRSIAVLGGKPAAEVIRQLRRIGYDGQIWPIHPRLDEVADLRAYPSVAALPAAPDAAFIGVNRHAAIEMIEALAARGAGGAVVYASGFSETGTTGEDLQARLIAAAGAMPFIGPNCYGFINYLDGTLLWPDQHGGRRVERGVAILTQSGNIGCNLTMQRRGLPIAYLLTLGNQAAIGIPAMIEALLADERVTAIGLHIEGIDDAAALARAAAAARQRGVPIVALKTGKTAAGADLTLSHTASLAGADAAMDAFLRRAGIVRVTSIPVLLESLKLLHVHGPLPARDIASLSCSGGEAALLADAVTGRRLAFRALTPAQATQVAATLPKLVTVSNPLDYHTFTWGNEAALTETFAAMMAADYAMTMLVLDFPRLDRCDDADWRASERALIAAAQRSGARAAIVATLPEAMPEERAETLLAAGIVPLLGVDDALAAIEAASDAGAAASRPQATITPFARLVGGASRVLSEWDSKRLLASHGLGVPEGRLARSADEAAAAAVAIGFPVALKAVGTGIAHKTEIGGIRLDLGDAEAVRHAARELQGIGDALLVERMVTDAVAELIIGVNRDPVVGPYLLVGAGGVNAELLGDTRILIMPATRDEITEAILSLMMAPLLAGYRGRPKGDVAAIADAVLAVQSFAVAQADHLLELDVNPLMVRPEGCGAVAVDALIRITGEDAID
ncbi:MAG TPA: acetate--CoA ligase family protein [Stellaceae bacterium]|nr:acetate--CoA ligase family protein [Stellaceae bacterium]